jgi:hypothetical protein
VALGQQQQGAGLVGLSAAELFRSMGLREHRAASYRLHVSWCEVRDGEVYDLLSPATR